MHIVRQATRVLVAAVFALSLSGCLFHAADVYNTSPAADGSTSASIGADVTVNPCTSSNNVFTCHFTGPFGFDVAALFGLTGSTETLLNWLDPIVLQVPVAITVNSANFSGPANGSLIVTTVTGALQADATRQIVPEAGTKFLVIDFPGGVPTGGAGKYHYALNLRVPGGTPSPLSVKVLFAAKVTAGGQTFYPPLLPCTTDMAAVPALTLPADNAITPFNPTPFLAQQGCNNITYDVTPGGSPPTATVVEYHHAGFDHYFITPLPTEIALLDAQTPPFQGWARTGTTFKAYVNATAPAGSVAICRFFNDHFAPKSSHFYAAHGFGCEDTLALFPDWGLEDDKLFNTMLPIAGGACPAGTSPLYRTYNQGMGAAPNHRFVTSLAEQQVMVDRGYAAEGVVMCVPS
jgi:hypothetical protein